MLVPDGGVWSMPRPGRCTPGKEPVPIGLEAKWAPVPVWTGVENLVPLGFDPLTVQPIANRYNDCAIPAHIFRMIRQNEKIYQDAGLTARVWCS